MRTHLHADPSDRFLHDAVLAACASFGTREAIVDTSCNRRITYAEYGELVSTVAHNLVVQGLQSHDVVAIFLANSWEYAVLYHAVTLAGGVPTLLNPSYREREARYQLEDSGATMLCTDAAPIAGMDLRGLPALRRVYTIRQEAPGLAPFSMLLRPDNGRLRAPPLSPAEQLAALPYSSGTTGLPKGVMLTHTNLVANCYQYLAPGELGTPDAHDRLLCFLPLYHIYGLNVVLNPTLITGGTLVLMPRFDADKVCSLLVNEAITYLPQVPPVMNALCQMAEAGRFPRDHVVSRGKSGAAPLAAELARRFTDLTGIPVRQGYGMTEASPVTHLGFVEPELYRPDTIGQAVAQTECRVVDESGAGVADGEPGELWMRGPQFMRGYWRSPEATAAVLQDGWYHSGDVVVRDRDGFFKVVDRRKEMIKYNGFPIAPAEVEAVLLEHPAVRDCGVVGRPDSAAGEVPVAFIVLRDGESDVRLGEALCGFVGDRLVRYKQPHEVRFVTTIPRNPSGKILRKDLRAQL